MLKGNIHSKSVFSVVPHLRNILSELQKIHQFFALFSTNFPEISKHLMEMHKLESDINLFINIQFGMCKTFEF